MKTEKSNNTMQSMERKLQKADRKQASLYLFCNFISLMLISAYSAMSFHQPSLVFCRKAETAENRCTQFLYFLSSAA